MPVGVLVGRLHMLMGRRLVFCVSCLFVCVFVRLRLQISLWLLRLGIVSDAVNTLAWQGLKLRLWHSWVPCCSGFVFLFVCVCVSCLCARSCVCVCGACVLRLDVIATLLASLVPQPIFWVQGFL